MKQQIHYLASRQAFRFQQEFGKPADQEPDLAEPCSSQGTQRITMDIDEVTCRACKRWYWHGEGLQLSAQGAAYVASLAN